ncbi:MAG TPA: ATP-binding protein, partial [Candidatus Cloacimonadota bacterium]|nr:ATP-binding protein [Candidatus Cloacimonadota bacterium]
NSLRFTDSGYIMIRTSALDHELLIEVSDSGRGIEEHHLGRIFERFYVAEASRNRNLSGSGLGLAIVKHIVQLHRGRIEVESEPERGTTFKIWLPTAQAASAW